MGVFKRGRYWWIGYSIDGQRFQESTKQTSKTIAEAILGQKRQSIIEGKFFPGKKNIIPITFNKLVEKFYEYTAVNNTPRTLAYHKDKLSKLCARYGSRYVNNITVADIEEYKATRLKEVQAVSLNHEIKVLKKLYNHAVEWNYIESNPFAKLKALQEEAPRLRYLSLDEIDLLLNNVTGTLRVIVNVALDTGMRKGEIFSLKWDDIDTNNLHIHLPKTKTGKARDIPITAELLQLLNTLPRKTEKVFNQESCNTSWRTLKKKTGINNLRFHDLRTTFASWMIMNGVDITTVARLLGHSDIQMTYERYAGLSPDHRRDAIENLHQFYNNHKRPE